MESSSLYFIFLKIREDECVHGLVIFLTCNFDGGSNRTSGYISFSLFIESKQSRVYQMHNHILLWGSLWLFCALLVPCFTPTDPESQGYIEALPSVLSSNATMYVPLSLAEMLLTASGWVRISWMCPEATSPTKCVTTNCQHHNPACFPYR